VRVYQPGGERCATMLRTSFQARPSRRCRIYQVEGLGRSIDNINNTVTVMMTMPGSEAVMGRYARSNSSRQGPWRSGTHPAIPFITRHCSMQEFVPAHNVLWLIIG
jgi:hypothetical protein